MRPDCVRLQQPASMCFRRGITLTEMLVVITIIIIILGISLPAAQVWKSRQQEEAINLLSGLLYTSQLGATIDNQWQKRYGLFFYIDPATQNQVVWPIEQDYDPRNVKSTYSRYILRDMPPLILPGTMRVTPVEVVSSNSLPQFDWNSEQLMSDDYRAAPGGDAETPDLPITTNLLLDPEDQGSDFDGYGTQFHRNFFVVLFESDGQIISGYRAYIIDTSPENYGAAQVADENGLTSYAGFHTGLDVLAEQEDTVPEHLHGAIADDAGPFPQPIPFASTAGILVYDNEEFQAIVDDSLTSQDERREFLRLRARPIYVQGVTGEIIKGKPLGSD